MVETALPTDDAELFALLDSIPNVPGVFLLWPRGGSPWMARTNLLGRRIKRMVSDLRESTDRIEYHCAASKLESRFIHLRLAKQHLGADYRREIRLRLPPYLKLLMVNEFPRTQVAARIGRSGASLYVGPFRNRSTAARFEAEFLDLFQLRRCQEDLAPSQHHPGCIYGEMGRCLRPCQQVVSAAEYRNEALRVAEFLRSGGKTLIASAMRERDLLSEEMDFEAAARAHQRLQRIGEVLAERDEMARSLDDLHAVAIVSSSHAECVELGWLRGGYWQGFRSLHFLTGSDGHTASLDSRLREMAATIPPESTVSATERMDHLAVLSRWFYSDHVKKDRQGEMIVVDDWNKMPWRKLVNAVSRVAALQRTPRPNTRS